MYQIESNVFSGGKKYRFIGIEGDRVAYLKDSPERNVRTIRLEDKFIYPGFIDSHTHLLWYGLNLIRCNLSGVKSEQEIYRRIAKYSKESKNEYLIAEGFDETTFRTKKFPSKKMLDKLFPDRPVIVRRICGHAAVLNRQAEKLLKKHLDTGYDSENGVAKEGIILSLNTILKPSKREMMSAMKAAQSSFFSLGITSIGDMATFDSLEIYRSKELKLSVFFYYPAMMAERLSSWKDTSSAKLKGLKLFTDGSIGARTAALFTPYKNSNEKGEIVLKETDFRNAVKTASQKNYQLAIHAIGDRAIDYVLKTLKGRSRDRIEHFELASKEQIEQTKKGSIMLSMQPNFIGNWSMKNQMYEDRLPVKYYKFNNVVSEIHKSGIPLGFGSDCMPPSPLYGMESLVKAQFKNQRMDPFDSLQCYTQGSALIMNESTEYGNLSKGSYADMVVLDSPIEQTNRRQPRVLMTFKKGKKVFTKE